MVLVGSSSVFDLGENGTSPIRKNCGGCADGRFAAAIFAARSSSGRPYVGDNDKGAVAGTFEDRFATGNVKDGPPAVAPRSVCPTAQMPRSGGAPGGAFGGGAGAALAGGMDAGAK